MRELYNMNVKRKENRRRSWLGNTLDKALTAVVGCKERGRQVDGPLDHSTGKGWVKDHAYGKGWVKTDTGWKWTGAQYYDAKWVKKAITRLVLPKPSIVPNPCVCWLPLCFHTSPRRVRPHCDCGRPRLRRL